MLFIDVVTLFPEMFAPLVGLSIVGRAHERGIVSVTFHNILDALDPDERADDRPYGGGPGMIVRAEPIARILDAIFAQAPARERRIVAATSPAGKPFTQHEAERFAELERLIVICGRYEGIDERIIQAYDVQEFSLGDFILTGGEIPAAAFIDATVRLLDGALNRDSLAYESFGKEGLEAPTYTRPATFRGINVPPVLLSGDHAKIAAWRREQSRLRTASRRPDLLSSDSER